MSDPMRLSQIREFASQWLAHCAPPSPVLKPYPGWRLGIGERRSGRISTKIRRQLWYGVNTPVLTPWLDGLRVYAYPRNETSRALFVTGYYEPNEFYFLSQVLRPGMVFVDVGANMGLYTLFAARKVGESGTVLAIEPSNRECDRLLKNAAANSLSNIRLLHMAVSDSSSQAELLVASDERSGHNTLGAFGYDTPLASKESVRTEQLDEIILQEGLQRVDVIKMDIEGAEFHALRGAVGAIERFQPILMLELADRVLCHQGSSSGEIWTFCHQRRYKIFSFNERTGLLEPAQQKPYYDSENVVALPESCKLPAAWQTAP
jgi:FkbM family methyltransferase